MYSDRMSCDYCQWKKKKLVGPAIRVATAWALQAPPLVLFSSVVTGALDQNMGREAAAVSVSSVVKFIMTGLVQRKLSFYYIYVE